MVGLVVWLTMGPLGASPTGLNNIPTVDKPPQKVLVWQQWSNFASGEDTVTMLGIKYGLTKELEIGLDGPIGPSPVGPMQFQAKYTFPTERPDQTKFCLGVANVTGNAGKANPIFPYVVAAQQFPASRGTARGHLGFAPQRDANQLFLGVDYSSRPGLLWRADYIHNFDAETNLSSVGLLHEFQRHFAVEFWVSFPETGPDTVWTLKFDFLP